MPERKLMPSDPAYEEVNLLQELLCLSLNPHMVYGLTKDLPEAELRALAQTLRAAQKDALDLSPFTNFYGKRK